MGEHVYEEELAGRLKLDNLYLKNELKKVQESVEIKNNKISELQNTIKTFEASIDNIEKEYKVRESDLVERIKELEVVINPPQEEKKNVFVRFLDIVGIKVSEY